MNSQPNSSKTIKLVFLWLSPIILAAIAVVAVLHRTAVSNPFSSKRPNLYWGDRIEKQVRTVVSEDYVDRIPPGRAKKLFYDAMQGYLQGLDEYCSFYDPAARKALEEENTGQFGGVGIQVDLTSEDGKPEIVGLRKGDPAMAAGIELGDRIVTVDGRRFSAENASSFVQKIRGAPGTKVTLGVDRGGKSLSFTLVRSKVKSDSVVGVRVVGPHRRIGYLHVTEFQESTGADARVALKWLMDHGAKAFVLDLRGNPGGILEQGAVALVNLFLSKGIIVQTNGRSADSKKVYRATADTTICPDQPLVVLVDAGSASASEVVSSAFQDYRRGLLVGDRTFGKFLVQSILDLPGSKTAMKLTTARYYSPFGRQLQQKRHQIRGGLVPDVVVKESAAEQEKLVRQVFAFQHGSDWVVSREPEQIRDPQLEKAVDLLSAMPSIGGAGAGGGRAGK